MRVQHMVVNWGEICEIEILRMIDEYYQNQGYSVEWTHGKSELGADLVCSKDEGSIIVLAKKNPRQPDLGQVPLAKRNYPNADYKYFYVGRPSGNFLTVMRNDYQDVLLINEESMERLMFDTNNASIFRFLIQYSIPIVRIAKIIKGIFTARQVETEEFAPTTTIYSAILGFHEGLLQTREIVESAISEGQRLLDSYPEFYADATLSRDIAREAAQVFQDYLDRLEISTNKMMRLIDLNEDFLLRKLCGHSVWGGTLTGFFGTMHLDQGDWGQFSNTNDRRHLLKILYYLSTCESAPQHYGILEALGHLQSIKTVLKTFKSGSENLLRFVFDCARAR